MDTKIILINGKPGSGKTTAAAGLTERISNEHLPVFHFSMGNRLRSIAGGETPSKHSEAVKNEIDKLFLAKMITPSIPALVLEEVIERNPNHIIVVDGYPRTKDQLPSFHKTAKKLGSQVLSFELIISDSLACERLLSRNQRLGEAEYTQEMAERRVQEYAEITAPVIDEIADSYYHVPIDASRSLNDKLSQMEKEAYDYLASLQR